MTLRIAILHPQEASFYHASETACGQAGFKLKADKRFIQGLPATKATGAAIGKIWNCGDAEPGISHIVISR